MFDKSLKQHIVFSDHSLATDSVFAEVQLVSCRNVLIYFNRELQDRALGLFRDALCRKGFLGLGAKESLRFSSHADAFDDGRRDGSHLPEAGRADDAACELACGDVEAVVIGASAGGVEALCTLLPALPAALRGARCFIVLHLPRERPSLLAEIFAPQCAAAGRARPQDKEPVAGRHGLLRAARLPSAGRSRTDQLALSADEPVHFSRPVDRRAVRVGGRRVRRAACSASS